MRQDDINSLVMVEFYICAERLNFDEINSMLKIPNPEERKRESFIYREFAKDYWSVGTGYKKAKDVNEQMEIILDLLQPKIEMINEIKDKFKAECGFVVVIKSGDGIMPAVYFEQNVIQTAAQLGADINLDFS